MNDHVFCHFYRTYRTSCDRRRVPLYRLPLPIAVTFCIFHVLIPWKTLKTPQMHQPITTPVSHSLTNGKMWKCPFPVLSVLYKCKMSIIFKKKVAKGSARGCRRGGWEGVWRSVGGRVTYFCKNTWFRLTVCGCEVSEWVIDRQREEAQNTNCCCDDKTALKKLS